LPTATLLPFPRAVFYDALGNPLAAGLVHTYVPGGTTPQPTWQDQAETIPNANPIVLDANGSCLLYGSGNYQITVTDSLGNQVPAYSGLTYSLFVGVPAGTTVIPGDLAAFGAVSGTLADSGIASSVLIPSIATIGALQSATTTTLPTSQCYVEGYAIPGDGGGGQFVVRSTTAANGVTVFTDASGRTWQRLVFGSEWSVAWGGATPTATDNTSAVNNVIAAIVAFAGGTVVFPAGIFTFLGTINVSNSGVQIKGSGQFITVLRFANGANDCIAIAGTGSSNIAGNSVRDLSITGSAKTGGRAIYFGFANNWIVERVYFNTIWNGIEAYVINTGIIRNCTMAGVTNPSGWCIYFHAPGDGSYRSDELNLHDVVVNPLYSGADGLVIDGWANTVNAYQYVALDVARGLRVLNTTESVAYCPTYGEFVNSVVDGASVRAIEINAGTVWRFTGCEIGNNSGSSGQGSSDDYAFFVAPDTGHSETSQISAVNCNIGGCKQSAVDVASHDNTFVACTFYQGITSPSNTWSSVIIAAPASDTIIMACKNSYFGDPNAWSYGVTMEPGTFRTLVLGCNFNIGSMNQSINDLSGNASTFANEYIGSPFGAGTGPVVNFPRYVAAPANPVLGESYYNTVSNVLQYWNGTSWVTF
jgi:hypothetical protein